MISQGKIISKRDNSKISSSRQYQEQLKWYLMRQKMDNMAKYPTEIKAVISGLEKRKGGIFCP